MIKILPMYVALCHTKNFKSLLSPSSYWRLVLQLLTNPICLAMKHGSRVCNGSGQLWTIMTLSDSVNYPIISEISV